MKKLHPVALLALVSLTFMLFACNDSTVIGSDLLEGDQLDINSTDTLTLRAWTVSQDSVKTYDPNPSSSNYTFFSCGDFRDPIFGRSIARINAQLSLNVSNPDFRGATIDSAVLILPYRADQAYGKLNETFSLEVWELEGSLSDSASFFSNQKMALKPSSIGYAEFVPEIKDSMDVELPKFDKPGYERLPAHLRIPMNSTFIESFLGGDSITYTNNSLFKDFFRGIQLRAPESGAGNNGILSFEIRHPLTGLQIYYHKDTIYSQYRFPVFSSSIVTAEFEQDFSGSFVDDYIDNTAPEGEDLLFLQSMSGVNFDLEIPYLSSLKNVVINRAELILPIVGLPGDDPDYKPADQLVVAAVISEDNAQTINDIIYSINRAGDSFYQLFGGNLLPDNTYRVNISSHFKDMITGRSPNRIRFIIYQKPQKASRVVIGGPTHPTQPLKLRLSFTKF